MKVPKPLRSPGQPDQLDGLGGVDKVKVEKANMLYDAVLVLATKACELLIFPAIENPTISHYWSTTPMQMLCAQQEHHFVTFHTCAHGGDRDKSTSLWVNDDWLDELAIQCNKQHKHKPWTTKLQNGGLKFSTSEEAAYPHLLCDRIVNCLKRVALQQGHIFLRLCRSKQQGQIEQNSPGLSWERCPEAKKSNPWWLNLEHTLQF